MQARYKWLLLPPALAVVLLMGPLRQSAPAGPVGQTPGDSSATDAAASGDVIGKSLVPVPDAWQLASSLLGVLLLGGAGIMFLARIRRGTTTGGGELMSLRQSLRLSQRHALHAVEFDDNILLLSESDGHLGLIKVGRDPQHIDDERQVTGRGEEEDGGAVPRDMIIPRPELPSGARLRPPTDRSQRRATIDDFKELLRSVKTGSRR